MWIHSNLHLGSGNDVFNVQGTSAVTNLDTAGGEDQIYVSSTANASLFNNEIGFLTGNVVGFSGDDQPALAFELPDSAVSVTVQLWSLEEPTAAVVRTIEIAVSDLTSLSVATGSFQTNWDGTDDSGQLLSPGAYGFNVTGVRDDDSTFAGVTAMKGTLDDLGGRLNIDAGSETNRLMVSDVGSRDGDADVRITNNQIRGLAPWDINYITTDPSGAGATFAGGITVWSGYGDDTIAVSSTRKDFGPIVDGLAVRTTTTLNTGLGDDSVTVDLNAETDEFFVLNTQGPFGHDYLGTQRTDNDDVDASGSTLPLIIFGGQGDDTIAAGSRDDIVFGDRGRVEMRNAESDIVQVLGWGGLNDRTDGRAHLVSTVRTVDPTIGGQDSIADFGGANIILGGADSDYVNFTLPSSPEGAVPLDGPEGGNDLIAGDHALVDFDTSTGVRVLLQMRSIDPSEGGDDYISSRSGIDLVFGGTGGDTIDGGNDQDRLLGDHGLFDINLPVDQPFQSIFIGDGFGAGNDLIDGGDQDDVLLGQQGDDTLRGGAGEDDLTGGHNVVGGVDGDDVLVGDDGRLELQITSSGQPVYVIVDEGDACERAAKGPT